MCFLRRYHIFRLTTTSSDGSGNFFPFSPSFLHHPFFACNSLISPTVTRNISDKMEITMADEFAVDRAVKNPTYVCKKKR